MTMRQRSSVRLPVWRIPLLSAALAVALVAVGGCGGDDEPGADTSPAATVTQTVGTPPDETGTTTAEATAPADAPTQEAEAPATETTPPCPVSTEVCPAGTPTPGPTPISCMPGMSAVISPLPNLGAGPRGLAIARGAGDLWVVSLDDPAQRARLTLCSGGAHFVGSLSRGGEPYIYFASYVTGGCSGAPDAEGSRGAPCITGRVAVYEIRIAPGQTAKELFAYEPMYSASGTLSPDGRRIAYAAAGGMHIRDLRDGNDALVFANDPCDTSAPAKCHNAYDAAGWSADGRYLAVYHSGWEGGRMYVADMQASQPMLLEMRLGASAGSWARDSSRFCGSRGTYGPATGVVFDVNVGAGYPFGPAPHWYITGCAWRTDGTLAATFSTDPQQVSPPPPPEQLQLFDRSLERLSDTTVPRRMVDWTADEAELVLDDGTLVDPATGRITNLDLGDLRVLAVIPSR